MPLVRDYPDLSHLNNLKEYSLNQAALACAGIDPFEHKMHEVVNQRINRWKIALSLQQSMISSIRNGTLSPQVVYGSYFDGSRMEIDHLRYDADIDADYTIISKNAMTGWIKREHIDIVRPYPEKNTIQNEYTPNHDSELKPLLITHHKSKGIELIEDVNKQFYSTFDAEDLSTAPKKNDVVNYLTEKGASKSLANAVDIVMRPDEIKTIGRPRSNK